MLTLQQRILRFFLGLTPTAIAVLLVLVQMIGQQRYGLAAFLPVMPLAAIYYWSLHSPRRMPYGVAFLIGLLYDSLFGLPLGVSSLLFMLFKWLLHAQHKKFAKEAFGMIWLCFATLAAVVVLGQWTMTALYHGAAPPMGPAFMQLLLTVIFYPVLHFLFMRMDGRMYRRSALLAL